MYFEWIDTVYVSIKNLVNMEACIIVNTYKKDGH